MLHDIGKLVQRAASDPMRTNHAAFGYEFLDRLSFLQGSIGDQIRTIVRRHHDSAVDGAAMFLHHYVHDADAAAAGHDREGSMRESSIQDTPLLSIFSRIRIDKQGKAEDLFHELASADSGTPWYPTRDSKADQQRYARILRALESDLSHVHGTSRHDITTLTSCLMKHTRFVPSAIYKTVPDIPLFDHLKVTAAIATCLHRTGQKIENPFLFVLGDLSGIQEFIFYQMKAGESDVADEDAARRMRGRSMLVNLAVDAVAKAIIDELGLYEVNVLWASGGNFMLVVPNMPESKDALETIRKAVNTHLVAEYGRLYMTLAWQDAPESDIANPENFKEFLTSLHQELDTAKTRKQAELIDADFFRPRIQRERTATCLSCGIHPAAENGERCETCSKLVQLGMVVSGQPRLLCRGEGNRASADIVFRFGNRSISYMFCNEHAADYDESFCLNGFDLSSGCAGRGFKLIGNHAPVKEGHIISFSHLIDAEPDVMMRKDPEHGGMPTKLAVLKLDVDNLSMVFSHGLEGLDSISRYTMLS
ncbi:MAG: type III-A CRISPR-associated protein Cas10/Csm1, partial [Candidatus Sigynarchaeota archaeon]